MRIAAFLAVSLLLAAGIARADDYGPHPALRAIRSALPVLLATRLKVLHATERVTVPDVVVDGNSAIAGWSAGHANGLALFARHPNGWWMTGEANRVLENYWSYDNPGALPICVRASVGPTSEDLRQELHPPVRLLELAAAHIAEIAQGDAELAAYSRAHPGAFRPGYHEDCFTVGEPPLVSTLGGYLATWTFPAHAAGSSLRNFTFRSRAPTDGEMAPARGADSIFFFTIQSRDAQNARVASGSTLDVWSPFVLDPSLRYTLTLALGDPTIGPLAGTLGDNTLHFALPAFTAPPSVELMGEIDGDPPGR